MLEERAGKIAQYLHNICTQNVFTFAVLYGRISIQKFIAQPKCWTFSPRVVPDFSGAALFCLPLFQEEEENQNENDTAALKTFLKKILQFKDGDFY